MLPGPGPATAPQTARPTRRTDLPPAPAAALERAGPPRDVQRAGRSRHLMRRGKAPAPVRNAAVRPTTPHPASESSNPAETIPGGRKVRILRERTRTRKSPKGRGLRRRGRGRRRRRRAIARSNAMIQVNNLPGAPEATARKITRRAKRTQFTRIGRSTWPSTTPKTPNFAA